MYVFMLHSGEVAK